MTGSLSGRTLGDFILKDCIGSGGAGEVYLAEQVSLGRDAVIKVALNRAGPAVAKERFLREARLASRLEHPFTAHVYGFGSERDGTDWIAMELVRGENLHARITRLGPFSLTEWLPLFERICEAVQEAHGQGIVHRDLKPQNIMLLDRGGRLSPKLLDFGLARRTEAETHVVEADAPAAELDFAAEFFADQELSEDGRTLGEKLAATDTLSLTQEGSFVGTPEYMAPEQWKPGAAVDHRTDIYALGFIAFYALTGRHPFSNAGTVWTIAAAHLKEPLPPLPAHLPEALNAVLQRATAKLSADRVASATELALALREASSLADAAAALPTFEKTLKASVLARAPQPVAEALAFAEAARSEASLLAALGVFRTTIERHTALVALAAWVQQAPSIDRSSPLSVLLDRLMSAGLDREGWLALSRVCLEPFAESASNHPVPELVEAFFKKDGQPGPAQRAFETVGATAREEIDALAKVLTVLGFLFDYPLAVSENEGVFSWTGTRRPARLQVDKRLPLGPWLLAPDGEPALRLAPFCQVFSPGGAMASELFMLEANDRSGARLVAYPLSFERQRNDVWESLQARCPWLKDVGTVDVASDTPPYKGLSSFSTDDADNYFGREEESDAFANRLRKSPLLAVVGPSGTGKSSFVLAGVLPRLGADYAAVTLRPGRAPFAALQGALATARQGAPKLVVVDQFEELVTQGASADTQQAFARELVRLADTGEAKVVITLRDDFLIRVLQLEALHDRLSSCIELLGTPSPDRLRRVITEPARRVDYRFDDELLPDRMVESVAHNPGALALLSFTAAQLWETRDRSLRLMRARSYESMGGVGGALAHHAEQTRSAMDEQMQPVLREAFRHLVTAQGTRAVMTRQELLEALGSSEVAARVIDALVASRLCVSSENADGSARIEIIHEALIVSWPRLGGWIREDAESVRLRETLRSSARQWQERGRPRGLLWRDETLAEYKVWKKRAGGGLTQNEEAFAIASLRQESLGRRTRAGLAAVAVLLLVTALILIANGYRKAHAQLLALRQEQGRVSLQDGRPLEALAYLAAASEGGAENDELSELVGLTMWQLDGRVSTERFAAPEAQALFDPVERVLVSSSLQDGSMVRAGTRSFPVARECALHEWREPGRSVLMFCGARDLRSLDLRSGEVTAIATEDLSIHDASRTAHGTLVMVPFSGLWTLAPKKRIVELPDVGVAYLRPSPTGRHVAAIRGAYTQPDGLEGLRLFDGATTTAIHDIPVVSAVGFLDDRLLAIGGGGGELALYDLQRRRTVWRTPTAHTSAVSALLLQGDRVLSSGADGTRLWRASDGALLWFAPEKAINRRALAMTDTEVVVGTESGVVAVLEAKDGQRRWRHHGHIGPVISVSVVDATVVSTGEDGFVYTWRLAQSALSRIDVPGSALDVALDVDGDGDVVISSEGVYADGVRVRPNAGDAAPIARAGRFVAAGLGNTIEIFEKSEVLEKSGDTWTRVRSVSTDGTPIYVLLDGVTSDLAATVLEENGARHIERFSGDHKQVLRPPPDTELSGVFTFAPGGAIVACGTHGALWRWQGNAPVETLRFLNLETCWVRFDGTNLFASDVSGKTGRLDGFALIATVDGAAGHVTSARVRKGFDYLQPESARFSRYSDSGTRLLTWDLLKGHAATYSHEREAIGVVDASGRAYRFSPPRPRPLDKTQVAERTRFFVDGEHLSLQK